MNNSNTKFGLIPAAGFDVKTGLDFNIPAVLSLTSVNAGRKIELSTDGINFFQPTYDQTIASMINVALLAPILSFRVTGTVGDQWSLI